MRMRQDKTFAQNFYDLEHPDELLGLGHTYTKLAVRDLCSKLLWPGAPRQIPRLGHKLGSDEGQPLSGAPYQTFWNQSPEF